MKKLATYQYVFWKSISSFAYYRDVVKATFSFSFKYFLVFSGLIGLLLTISLSFTLIPPVSGFVRRLETRAVSLFPADLVISVKNGQMSTNVTEPLRFPFPVELFSDTPGAISDQKQQYLVTIDTKAKTEDFTTSRSVLFVTRDNLVIADRNGGYRVYPLKDMGDITINKKGVDEFLAKSLPILKLLPILLIVLFFLLFTLALPLSRLVSLAVLSLLLHIASRFMSLQLGYKKIYQIGLHAMTLPTLIQIVMTAFGLIPPIPFFNSILYLLYALVILAELRKTSPPPSKITNS